ncbi:MAG: lytic murein transglycosylase [Hyphomonadaceae bacterium]
MKRAFHWIVASLALCLAAPACAQSPPPPAPVSFTSSGDPGFDAWRDGFAQRALAAGRSRQVVLQVLAGLSPDQRVIDLDRRQPEFVSPVWDYVTRAVSQARITQGRARRAENADLFAQIENRYGVDADIIAGIWAVETNFGTVDIPFDAARSIATLAYEGRRRVQFETYLLALLEMVERGYASGNELRSSWAGALGQPQFMPDVYLSLAVDWDGDGRRDIWGNRGDVFASVANYLAQRGWRRGEPVFDEVRLPQGFDYALADGQPRPLSDWAARGVRRIDGAAFAAPGLSAQLLLLAGAQGPALLVYENFQVIKRYNNSDRYALVVALLARNFENRGGLVAGWPTHLGSLNRDQILELQTALNAQGFDSGAPDGQFGSRTRAAVRGFQQARGLPADGFPTADLLRQVRAGASTPAAPPQQAAQQAQTQPPAPVAQEEPPAPRAPTISVARVRELQRLLRRLGFDPGPADGAFGSRTSAAIRAFEESAGRRVTGEATQQVLNAARRAARRRG